MRIERKSNVSLFVAAMLAAIVSFFYFPIGIRPLMPESLNTKQVMAVIGVAAFVLKAIRDRQLIISKETLYSFGLAATFSLSCFFSCIYNDTTDYAYAKYIMSFFVWLGGAYGVCVMFRMAYGRVDLPLLTKYLAFVGVFQCVSVLLVDNVEGFMDFVDTYIVQDKTAKRVERMYGFGCSLDSGGIRLCTILVLIAHQISTNKEVQNNKLSLTTYILAFFTITFIGNMIARTTTVGASLGLGYMALAIGVARRAKLNKVQLRFRTIFFILLGIVVVTGMYFYSHDPVVRTNIRFAFEAFFNYFETGEFSTSSSDILMERMWVWPWTTDGWVLGYGLYEWSNWTTFQTDIGYCRFTLYCGILGMSLFSLYFVYLSSAVRSKFRNAWLFSLLLLAMVFIVWVKVSTDIFQLFALLLCLPSEDKTGVRDIFTNR